MGGALCPRCACSVALHEGRPHVSASGLVELWHDSCWATRHARPVEEVTAIAPPPPARARHNIAAAIAAGAVVVGFATAAYALKPARPQPSLATIQIEPFEQLALQLVTTVHEALPPEHPVPTLDGTAIDEIFPSLLDWIHPVVGSDLVLSELSTGMFGAERDGVMRRECGRGHCGIDLAGPIGRPVVSVADGVVVRVEHSELGRDGRSGRYVRIEHADGTLTAYMHLSTITRGLEVGDRVDGGQQIGTLGASGVVSAAPHLHFSLEVPKIPGTHGGDHTATNYVDPAPFLVRATMLERADGRLKPAF